MMIFCPKCHRPNTTITWRGFRWSNINYLLAQYCQNCRQPLTLVCPVCRHLHVARTSYCTERGTLIAAFQREQAAMKQQRRHVRRQRRLKIQRNLIGLLRDWRSWAAMAAMWLIAATFGCYLTMAHDVNGLLASGASFLLKVGMSAILVITYIIWRLVSKRRQNVKKPR